MLRFVLCFFFILYVLGCKQLKNLLNEKAQVPLPRASLSEKPALPPGAIGQWLTISNYRIKVHKKFEANLINTIKDDKPKERVIYFEVEYNNVQKKSLNYSSGQWRLYDASNFVYEPLYYYNYVFKNRALIHLGEGAINPLTGVRGLIAFTLGKNTKPVRLQFMNNFLERRVFDIKL